LLHCPRPSAKASEEYGLNVYPVLGPVHYAA
jgi:hypothetical protein